MTEHRIGIIDHHLVDVAVATKEITGYGHVVVACAFNEPQAYTLLDEMAEHDFPVDALLIESNLSNQHEHGYSARRILERIDELGMDPFLIAHSTIGMPKDVAGRFNAHVTKTKMNYFDELAKALANIKS